MSFVWSELPNRIVSNFKNEKELRAASHSDMRMKRRRRREFIDTTVVGEEDLTQQSSTDFVKGIPEFYVRSEPWFKVNLSKGDTHSLGTAWGHTVCRVTAVSWWWPRMKLSSTSSGTTETIFMMYIAFYEKLYATQIRFGPQMFMKKTRIGYLSSNNGWQQPGNLIAELSIGLLS